MMHRTYSDAEQLCALVHKLNKSVNIYQLFLFLCFCLLFCVFLSVLFLFVFIIISDLLDNKTLYKRGSLFGCVLVFCLFVCMSSLELQKPKGKRKAHMGEESKR